MISLSLLLAPAAALAAPAQAPADLFKSACISGTVSLPRGSTAAVDYDRIPRAARVALGQTMAAPGDSTIRGAPRRDDVPNLIYQIGPGQSLFLLVPPAGGGATGRFAAACALVWKGEHFREGQAAILPDPPADLPPQAPQSSSVGLASIGTVSGGLFVSVTTLADWTVLKSLPQAQAPLPGER